jgi:hypothetical protein
VRGWVIKSGDGVVGATRVAWERDGSGVEPSAESKSVGGKSEEPPEKAGRVDPGSESAGLVVHSLRHPHTSFDTSVFHRQVVKVKVSPRSQRGGIFQLNVVALAIKSPGDIPAKLFLQLQCKYH